MLRADCRRAFVVQHPLLRASRRRLLPEMHLLSHYVRRKPLLEFVYEKGKPEMKTMNHVFAGLVPLATVLCLGCGRPPSGPPSSSPASTHAGHSEHDHGDHDGPTGEVAEQLAKLSSEDKALAEKQKICPVTDEPLGSMGVPPKVTVNGREVFLCCQGCEEELREKADEYLAKLPK